MWRPRGRQGTVFLTKTSKQSHKTSANAERRKYTENAFIAHLSPLF
uniref:Uncharacterized protein n=1 Tax=Anguilla anguilla TaxID=7936 RepID=A0A0E9U9G9_ANGAN